MKDGFLKVACATPAIRVADTDYNAGKFVFWKKGKMLFYGNFERPDKKKFAYFSNTQAIGIFRIIVQVACYLQTKFAGGAENK